MNSMPHAFRILLTRAEPFFSMTQKVPPAAASHSAATTDLSECLSWGAPTKAEATLRALNISPSDRILEPGPPSRLGSRHACVRLHRPVHTHADAACEPPTRRLRHSEDGCGQGTAAWVPATGGADSPGLRRTMSAVGRREQGRGVAGTIDEEGRDDGEWPIGHGKSTTSLHVGSDLESQVPASLSLSHHHPFGLSNF